MYVLNMIIDNALVVKSFSVATQLSSPVLTTAWRRVFRAGELGFIETLNWSFKGT